MTQEFEQKLRMLTQGNDELERRCQEYESKLTYAGRENEHLNGVIKSKIEEINNYDARVRSMLDEHETLNRKNQELINSNRKIAEFDNKITILSQ